MEQTFTGKSFRISDNCLSVRSTWIQSSKEKSKMKENKKCEWESSISLYLSTAILPMTKATKQSSGMNRTLRHETEWRKEKGFRVLRWPCCTWKTIHSAMLSTIKPFEMSRTTFSPQEAPLIIFSLIGNSWKTQCNYITRMHEITVNKYDINVFMRRNYP